MYLAKMPTLSQTHLYIFFHGGPKIEFFWTSTSLLNFYFGHTPTQNTKVSASRKTTLEFIISLKIAISQKQNS
jgi:hypothetical protein